MKNWLVILDGIVWKINPETKELSINEKIDKYSVIKINRMLDKRIKLHQQGLRK